MAKKIIIEAQLKEDGSFAKTQQKIDAMEKGVDIPIKIDNKDLDNLGKSIKKVTTKDIDGNVLKTSSTYRKSMGEIITITEAAGKAKKNYTMTTTAFQDLFLKKDSKI